MTHVRSAILRAGEDLGFVRPRVAAIGPTGRDAFYRDWLADGRADDMGFLRHHAKVRLDPRRAGGTEPVFASLYSAARR